MTFAEAPLPALLAVPFYGLLLLAAWTDLRSLTIPNALTAALTLLFPAAAQFSGAPVDWAGHALTGLAVGVAALIPFLLRGLGGGDVKLLAAAGLWLGPDRLFAFTLALSMAGLVLALGVFLARVLAPRLAGPDGAARGPVLARNGPLPYGVAIAAAGWLTGPGIPPPGFWSVL